MDFRAIIADRMAELGMTQRGLQALTGVHQVRISDYLTRKRDMNGDNVAKLLEALDLEVKPTQARSTRARTTVLKKTGSGQPTPKRRRS